MIKKNKVNQMVLKLADILSIIFVAIVFFFSFYKLLDFLGVLPTWLRF